MAVVQSMGNLAELYAGWSPALWGSGASYGTGSLQMYDRFFYDYATLYRMQPNVRTCVDFLARNIAQLGLHVFRRVSETDRVRLRDYPLAMTLDRPLPPEFKMTRYRLVEALVSDLGIYFNAYWMKVRAGSAFGLLRVPPMYMIVEGGLVPTKYKVNLGQGDVELAPDQVVHFRGYSPENPIAGLSPLETLRRVLAEESAMGDYREYFWANSARMAAVLERPAEAPEWSGTARERFKAEFEALYSGTVNSGKTAIIEDGMTLKTVSYNAQESEYLGGRKLTREECARAYHIPLPMVGILDNATFSNIREQHKNLYQDCLGPWLAMLEQDIMLQLLPDFSDSQGVYVEFNIQEKLSGSFDEQTQSLQSAVGRPYMTADEARARLNLPSMGGDAAQLVTPLNVLVGGQASPRDSAPPKAARLTDTEATFVDRRELPKPGRDAKAQIDASALEMRDRHVAKWQQVISAYFGRQYRSLEGRAREGSGIETVWTDGERWDRELGADLFKLSMATATVFGTQVADELDADFDPDPMAAYLQGYTQREAAGINLATRSKLEDVLLAVDVALALKELFDLLASSKAQGIANSTVNSISNFGSVEGAKQGGLRTKTWIHNGAKDPRDSHIAMSGETVGIGDRFSNGGRWPGDPVLGAEENAYCHCSVEFGTE